MSTSLAATRFKIGFLLVGVLEISACHPKATQKPLSDPPQDVSSGSTLSLNRTIVIPAGSAAMHFQDTQLVAAGAIRPNYAYCKFALADPTDTVLKVEPRPFMVASVDYDERSVGSAGDTVSSTRMNLQSRQRTNAYRMTCMLPAAAAAARFVTVPEINGVLGSYFTLKRAY